MTVTVVTASVVAITAVVAVPLVCTGLALQWAPARHQVARLTGAALVVSGWLLLGIAEADEHAWWVLLINAPLVAAGIARVVAVVRAIRREQQ